MPCGGMLCSQIIFERWSLPLGLGSVTGALETRLSGTWVTLCWSKGTSTQHIRRKHWTPRVPNFKVTQGHRKCRVEPWSCEGEQTVFSCWPLAFCLHRYPPSDAEHHLLVLQGPCMQHGKTEISVDDARCHQWLTNQIAEAPLDWRPGRQRTANYSHVVVS